MATGGSDAVMGLDLIELRKMGLLSEAEGIPGLVECGLSYN